MNIETCKRCFIVAGLLALVGAVPVRSQDRAPLVRSVHVQLKSGHSPAWQAARRDLLAAHKKAGRGAVNVWQVVSGPSDEYWIVQPRASFADMAPSDWLAKTLGETEATQLIGRLQAAVKDRRILIARFLADLSIIPEDDKPAPYAIITKRFNSPGKRPDIAAYYGDKILPELKKAGVEASFVYGIFSGDDPRTTVFVEPFEKWSDLDKPNPLFQKLGGEAAGKLMYPFWRMFSREDRVILQHVPELSHNP